MPSSQDNQSPYNQCPWCHGKGTKFGCEKCGRKFSDVGTGTQSTQQDSGINRFEVIDHTQTGTGRDFVKWEEYQFEVKLDYQDGGRTLKVFLSDKELQNGQ